MSDSSHPDHQAELHRLKRISGQIAGIGRMIEEGRYCPEILIQTRAVSSAIRSLETALLKRHIQHCVQNAFCSEDEQNRENKISELIEIFGSRIPK